MSHIKWFYLILVVLGGGAIVSCLVKTQVVDGNFWRDKAKSRESMLQTVLAHRGDIISSDGKVLATTVPVCDLYIDLGWNPRTDGAGNMVYDKKGRPVIDTIIQDKYYKAHLAQVCNILHKANPAKSAEQYKQLITSERRKKKPGRCVPLVKKMPYSCWKEICSIPGWRKGVVQSVSDDQGNNSVIRYHRAHTYGTLAENCLGYYLGDHDSYTGLDGYNDSLLRGRDGLYLCRRLTRGVWMPVETGANRREVKDIDKSDSSNITVRQAVIEGESIVTTIDSRVQDVAEQSLRKYMDKYCNGDPKSKGAVVVMEVETGRVLACVSLKWDTLRRLYREKRDGNVACCDLYQPGSVFKTVAYTTMIDDLGKAMDTADRVPIGTRRIHNTLITDDDPADSVSVMTAMAKSSNVGLCSKVWQHYGDRQQYYVGEFKKRFPFEKLNVGLKAPNVAATMVPVKYEVDFLHINYGYAVSCTPLHIATFYAALGNGGRMMKPQFCQEIITRKGRKTIEPEVLRDSICSPRTAKIMMDMLANVVEQGTGNNIKGTPYGIAGKTGTSYIDIDSRYFNATFAGLFPAKSPKYACVVTVMGVWGMHGRQFAPVVKEVADCVMATHPDGKVMTIPAALYDTSDHGRPQMPKTATARQEKLMRAYDLMGLRYLTTDSNARWVTGVQTDVSTYQPIHIKPTAVPDCTGMTAREALVLLHSAGYKGIPAGYGRVTAQTPAAGTAAQRGTEVKLKLENRK